MYTRLVRFLSLPLCVFLNHPSTHASITSFSIPLKNERIHFHNVSLGFKHDYHADNATSEYCSLLKQTSKKLSDANKSLCLSFTPNRKPQKETVANAKLLTVLVDDNLYLLTTFESWKPNYFLRGKRSVVILFDYMRYELLQEKKNSIKDLDRFYHNLFEINLGLTPACVIVETIVSHSSHSNTSKSSECNHHLDLDQGYRVYSYSGPSNKTNYGVIFASVFKFPNPYLSQVYDDKEYGSTRDWKDSCFRGFFDFSKKNDDENLARCMKESRFNSSSMADYHHNHQDSDLYYDPQKLGQESYTYIKYTTWYPHGSFHLELIDFFDYLMKLDSDIWLHKPIPSYMLTHLAHDGAFLATGFPELTDDGDRGQVNETNLYVSSLAQTCQIDHLVPAFHPKVIKEFNDVAYSNFMVTWLGFFTSPQLMHYSRHWSKATSMFTHRWTDQQYWTIALLWFHRHKSAPFVTYLNYSVFGSHMIGDIDKNYLFNHKIRCVRLKHYEDDAKDENGIGSMYTTNASVEESLAVKMNVFHSCNLSITY